LCYVKQKIYVAHWQNTILVVLAFEKFTKTSLDMDKWGGVGIATDTIILLEHNKQLLLVYV